MAKARRGKREQREPSPPRPLPHPKGACKREEEGQWGQGQGLKGPHRPGPPPLPVVANGGRQPAPPVPARQLLGSEQWCFPAWPAGPRAAPPRPHPPPFLGRNVPGPPGSPPPGLRAKGFLAPFPRPQTQPGESPKPGAPGADGPFFPLAGQCPPPAPPFPVRPELFCPRASCARPPAKGKGAGRPPGQRAAKKAGTKSPSGPGSPKQLSSRPRGPRYAKGRPALPPRKPAFREFPHPRPGSRKPKGAGSGPKGAHTGKGGKGLWGKAVAKSGAKGGSAADGPKGRPRR